MSTMIAGANREWRRCRSICCTASSPFVVTKYFTGMFDFSQAGVTANVTGCTLSKGCGECA